MSDVVFSGLSEQEHRAQLRRALIASTVGTTIEWYDFLLYGTVSLEVFGHMQFALDDSAPMFELMLTDMAAMIGLDVPRPG